MPYASVGFRRAALLSLVLVAGLAAGSVAPNALAARMNGPSDIENPSGDDDQDGLTNLQESFLGTDPQDEDSDDDRLKDNEEVDLLHTDPLLYDTNTDDDAPSDYGFDNDQDGLSNGYEVNDNAAVGTLGNFTGEGGNPNNADTDEDGLDDLYEFKHAACGLDITIDNGDHDLIKDADEDCDGDGRSNLEEQEWRKSKTAGR